MDKSGEQEHPQMSIMSAKLICVPLLLRVTLMNHLQIHPMLLHDHKYVWLHIYSFSFYLFFVFIRSQQIFWDLFLCLKELMFTFSGKKLSKVRF